MSQSDEQLIERWRSQGDRSAIAELADRYLKQFYQTARALLVDENRAEDVAQDTMLKIVRSLDSFDARSPFRTWSYTILMNTLRSDCRRQQTRFNRVDANANVTTLAEPGKSVSSTIESIETNGRIEQAMESLTDKQRTAFVLMVVEGRSAADVAEIEGCSVDAIYQRVTEARKSLRRAPGLLEIWRGER